MNIDSRHFSSGHVSPVRDPGFVRKLVEAKRDFPKLQLHIDALRVLGSEIVFVRKEANGWIALVRLGRVLEGNFARNSEILLYVSTHHDLQLRDFQRLPGLAAQLPRRPDSEVYFVATSDLRAADKLQEWSARERYSAIALTSHFSTASEAAAALYAELANQLASRNLYEETLPVTGVNFFGRERLLIQLQDRLREGKVCGVFGLRKTGKTSILKELGRRFEDYSPHERIFLLRDLENLSGNSSGHVQTLQADLQSQLLTRFREHGIRTHELTQLTGDSNFDDFRRALQASLSHKSANGKQIVIAIDEIEWLIGDPQSSSTASGGSSIPQVFGHLRSLVQENKNFNVMMAGITDSVLHEAVIGKDENPLFAWAIPYYAAPMTKDECDKLVTKLGQRMALVWTPDALIEVFQRTEGHVFMLRSLCAHIVSEVHTGADRTISHGQVVGSARTWRRSISEQVHGMIGGLERYYPSAHTLLALVAENLVGSAEADSSYPMELHQLIQLGLLREEGDELLLTAFSKLASRG